MLKIIVLGIVVIIVLVGGFLFAILNLHRVDVNLFGYSSSWLLSLVVVSAFSAGVVTSMLVFMPLRFRIARLRGTVSEQENEITSLRKRLGSSVR